MKPSNQKSTNNKSKRNTKDKNGKKSHSENCNTNNHNSTEDTKSPPQDTKSPQQTSNIRQYTGIDSDSLAIYAEQSTTFHNLLTHDIDFTKEMITSSAASVLTEDINYWLRYVIYNSLVKARLMGSNVITSNNVAETFDDLSIEKVYGATSTPEWIKLESQNPIYALQDSLVQLSDIIEEEITYQQPGEVILKRRWLPNREVSNNLKTYFTTMCQMIINNKDEDLRKFALKNISENPQIGPIVEWFYNFGYFLLSKDITYDCLTLNALDLIKTLENSWTCRINVTEKKLKLLVRLILQRLLKTVTTTEVLKPMCTVLTILCCRPPLKEFVLLKISQKIPEVFDKFLIEVITLINSLGIEAIENVFLTHIDRFLNKYSDESIQVELKLKLKACLMETFNIILRNDCMDLKIYEAFNSILGNSLSIYSFQTNNEIKELRKKEDTNLIKVQVQSIKSRRKIAAKKQTVSKLHLEDVFDVQNKLTKSVSSKIQILYGKNRNRKPIVSENNSKVSHIKQEKIVIGQRSLLLPVFKKYQINQTIKYFNPSIQLSNY